MTESIRNVPPFGLRMQPELKEKLQRLAKNKGVSLNELINQTLTDVYRPVNPKGTVVVNLPDHLLDALEFYSERQNSPIALSIVEILREKFPNSPGIEAIIRTEEKVFEILNSIEEMVGDTGEYQDFEYSLLELVGLYRENFENDLSPSPPT